ncbi:RNase H domain-containing protein [Trichonephila clavipes]|nr:RNase H domain-containing protein [Trichonephila clavipes]
MTLFHLGVLSYQILGQCGYEEVSLLVWILPSEDLFGLGDPTSSLVTADTAFWVAGAHKPTHQDKVEIPAGCVLKELGTPSNHHWYESKHPGSSFLLKCDRASQTAISRLKSGHIKSLFFCGGRKTFVLCTKCKTQQASPDHILGCLGLSREDVFSSPLLVLDFLRVNGLLGLV